MKIVKFGDKNSSKKQNIANDKDDVLPIISARKQIMDAVSKNQVVIIQSDTGSGKTTQVPQFLYKAGFAKRGMIACTQPRRVAAISLAKRISYELGVKLGEQVGYSIRFEDCTSPNTKIKFMTDGMLLRELLNDFNLNKYSVIILDEAHERTLRTDILFGMVKNILGRRRDLKVIVMSATLDTEKFSKYFNDAAVVKVHGRLYPVKQMACKEPQQDYVESTLITIFQIHQEMPLGDILVFLTGQEEIESVEKIVMQNISNLPKDCPKLFIHTLFANLPTSQQTEIFNPAPKGCRKVILATNIAETSITIPGIKYVVDTGLRKMRGYIAKTGVETLAIQPISKANARQRAGRAGREGPGYCFRLYTESSFNELDENDTPEIKRCNLSNVLLLLKASGIHDVIKFDYIDPPARVSMVKSLEELLALGALNEKQEITDVGKKMASFPLDPPFAKVLIESAKFGCAKEIIDVTALLSVETLFFTPSNQRDEAYEARKIFISHDGDVITLFNVLQAYLIEGQKKNDEWLKKHFINVRSMKHVLDVRKQLLEYSEQYPVFLNSKGAEKIKNLSLNEKILCSLLSGFFTKLALKQPDNSYKSVFNNEIMFIHPSSLLFNAKPEVVLFTEVILTSKKYMRNVSRVDLGWLKLIDQNLLKL